MKVICINDGPLPSDEVASGDESTLLKEGEQYTVIDSFVNNGYCWFVLAEDLYNNDERGIYGFDSQRFVSLTDTNSAVEECVQILHVTEPKKKWYEKILNL